MDPSRKESGYFKRTATTLMPHILDISVSKAIQDPQVSRYGYLAPVPCNIVSLSFWIDDKTSELERLLTMFINDSISGPVYVEDLLLMVADAEKSR